MKAIRIGWDAPVGVVTEYYSVHTVEDQVNRVHEGNTSETEFSLSLPDDFKGAIEVRAWSKGKGSVPCAVWVEEFEVFTSIRDGRPVVAWQTVAGRVYALERSVDQGASWTNVGTYEHIDGEECVVGGGELPMAWFRVWSSQKGT